MNKLLLHLSSFTSSASNIKIPFQLRNILRLETISADIVTALNGKHKLTKWSDTPLRTEAQKNGSATLGTNKAFNLHNLANKLSLSTNFKNKYYSSSEKRNPKTCQHAASKKKDNGGGSGGFKWFIVKSLIASGTVYSTIALGIWGSSEETYELANKIKKQIAGFSNGEGKEISMNYNEQYNKTVNLFCNNLKNIPDTVSEIYTNVINFIKSITNPPK